MDYPYQMDGFPNPFESKKRNINFYDENPFKTPKFSNKKLRTFTTDINNKKTKKLNSITDIDNLSNKKIKIN